MTQYYDNISGLIGNTPLVKLTSLSSRVNFLGKLEYLNPGGSIKDRTASGLLEMAIKKGDVKPGMTIVESSSGNLGHSLAMICAKHKIKFTCIMDIKTPPSNVRLIKAFGGEVLMLTEPDADGGFQKARIRLAKKLAEEDPNIINLDQYSNEDAQNQHYESTGREILQQLENKVDCLVGSVSTGSSLCGTARRIKAAQPDSIIVAVEPHGSSVFGGEFKPFLQNGIGLSFRPDNYMSECVDYEMKAHDVDAFRAVREVARNDGLLLGGSSGSVIHAAKQIEPKLPDGANIVLLLADGGIKYIDTVYNDSWIKDKLGIEL